MKPKSRAQPQCPSCDVHTPEHPDHAKILPRLRRVGGQVKAIERMIGEKVYCPNILIQVRAASSALRAIEGEILKKHLHHCVKDAMTSKNDIAAEKKIKELIEIFNRAF